MILLNLVTVFCTKAFIEPFSDITKALSFTKLSSGNGVFDFQSVRRKEMSGVYCLAPIIVPISLVDYRFYFCGELMCYKEGILTVCDKHTDKASFNIIKIGEYYTIGKDGKCLHNFKGNLFLRNCDRTSTEQFFKIDPIQVPTSDNIDIEFDKRAESGGVKDIEFDKAMRQLSKIHHSEFIEDLISKQSRNVNNFRQE